MCHSEKDPPQVVGSSFDPQRMGRITFLSFVLQVKYTSNLFSSYDLSGILENPFNLIAVIFL